MKPSPSAVKFSAIALVLVAFTAFTIVVFGQIRFDRTNSYWAEFSTASGLRKGQFVRASGVEVGKVTDLRLVDRGKRVRIEFDVDRCLQRDDDLTRRGDSDDPRPVRRVAQV